MHKNPPLTPGAISAGFFLAFPARADVTDSSAARFALRTAVAGAPAK